MRSGADRQRRMTPPPPIIRPEPSLRRPSPGRQGLAPDPRDIDDVDAVGIVGDGDVAALRITGRPSLPAPMITTLALGDSASFWVASIPCQTMMRSLSPLLIVAW